jgi:hypothetical protein
MHLYEPHFHYRSREAPDAGSMVSFRVDAAVFEQLKAASKRRNTSVSAYCRDMVAAELHNRNEEGTGDIYRVAFKTLEEIEVVKAALFQSMIIIFQQNYNAPTPLTSEEQKLPPAEQEKRLNDPKRETTVTAFTRRVLHLDDNKHAKALEVLRAGGKGETAMVKMTKLDSAGQAQQYYKTEFSISRQKYFSDNQAVSGQWSGKLAEAWGLEGQVTEE